MFEFSKEHIVAPFANTNVVVAHFGVLLLVWAIGISVGWLVSVCMKNSSETRIQFKRRQTLRAHAQTWFNTS